MKTEIPGARVLNVVNARESGPGALRAAGLHAGGVKEISPR
jgi:hypothetical protein